MVNPDTDFLFPPRILPALTDLRGKPWEELVNCVIVAGPDSLEQVAFILMMARMNNCATCNYDSHRAMNGCTICTKQSLKRFGETDKALTEMFHSTREEVGQFLQKRSTPYQGDSINNLITKNR
jgi:hypothetical protein